MMYVAFFLEVGLLLLVLPWSAFWERNYFADLWPAVHDVITNDFVRGAISGLGIVNLLAGLVDLALVVGARHQHPLPATDRPDRQL